MKLTNFIDDGIWLKGNLHSHSTVSDGHLTPDQVISEFKNRGYQFLCLSDHNVFGDFKEYNDSNFVMIPGTELSTHRKGGFSTHIHMMQKGTEGVFENGHEFFMDKDPENDYETMKKFIQEHKDNYVFMLNHPSWHMTEWDEVIELEDVTFMEIYNHGTEWWDMNGDDHVFWETMLRKGKKWWGVADDDCHFGYIDEKGWPFENPQVDGFGGWINVKAKECTPESIMEAMIAGSFYASTGPEIHDFYLEDGIMHLTCSPCERILFMGNRQGYLRKIAQNCVEFHVPLKSVIQPHRVREKFIKATISDKYGRKAWSNPIYLDEFWEKFDAERESVEK